MWSAYLSSPQCKDVEMQGASSWLYLSRISMIFSSSVLLSQGYEMLEQEWTLLNKNSEFSEILYHLIEHI